MQAFCDIISEMPSMTYEEFERRGWKYAASETASKYFTSLEQHKKGKLLHNLKWGFPPKKAAADPQWLSEYIKQHGPFMYHATDADAAKSILNEGLYPHDHTLDQQPDKYRCGACHAPLFEDPTGKLGKCQSCDRDPNDGIPPPILESKSRSPWAGEHQEPRPGHAYLGTEKYAAPYAKQGGKMLKVDLRKLDSTKMNADEDHFAEHSNSSPLVNQIRGFDPPPVPESGESLGQWAERAIGGDPEATRHSMTQGSMAYNGVVPPEAISLHQPGQQPPAHAGWDLEQDPGPPMQVAAAWEGQDYTNRMWHLAPAELHNQIAEQGLRANSNPDDEYDDGTPAVYMWGRPKPHGFYGNDLWEVNTEGLNPTVDAGENGAWRAPHDIPADRLRHIPDPQEAGYNYDDWNWAVNRKTTATDANHWEAKMYHGNNKGLLRDIKTPFVTTDKPTDHPVSHEVSVTFRRPAHHFAPALTPEMIDLYQKAGHDGIVAHRPDSTWAIALDPGTIVPGHEHEFPY